MQPFHSQLSIYIAQNDIVGANELIMCEMGKIYVDHRPDFIALLQNSDLPAHAEFADEQLINMYFDNLHKKDLLIGSALLVNDKNKQSGFDGEMEISDKAVKDCYKCISSFLGGIPGIPNSAGYIQQHQFDWKSTGIDGEYQSNFPGAVALGAAAIGGASKIIANRRTNKDKAKADMQKAIQLKKQQAAANKAKNLRTGLIVGGIVAGLIVVGVLIYKFKKK
jgi:hypothetical protein